jgi:nicotinamidase-related amidase
MSDLSTWNLSRTALLTIDLQNDFLHPEGAYGRAGQSSAKIAALARSHCSLGARLAI